MASTSSALEMVRDNGRGAEVAILTPPPPLGPRLTLLVEDRERVSVADDGVCRTTTVPWRPPPRLTPSAAADLPAAIQASVEAIPDYMDYAPDAMDREPDDPEEDDDGF